MDEARRFLRYVIPGLSFIIHVSLFMWLILPDWKEKIIIALYNTKGLGIPISILFASTGLGFIFGVIHHQILWCFPKTSKIIFKFSRVFDFTYFLNELKYKDYIVFVNIKDNAKLEKQIDDRFDAWKIVCGLWYSRLKTNPKIKSTEPRSDSLTNSAHSMGTARVALVSAIIVVIIITLRVSVFSPEKCAIINFITMVIISLGLFLCHHWGYYRSMRIAQKIIEQVLADVLIKESASYPIKIYISDHSCPN